MITLCCSLKVRKRLGLPDKLERSANLLLLALRLSHIPMLALKGKGGNTHPFPDIVTRELFGLSGRVHLNSQPPVPTALQMTRWSCAKNSQVLAGVLRDLGLLRRAQS